MAGTILRFSFVLAEEGGILNDFERAVVGPFAIIPGSGQAKMQPILREDAARCVVETIARPELMERRPTWGAGQRNFTSLHLEALPEGAMRELLDAESVSRGLRRVAGEIIEHARGVEGLVLRVRKAGLAAGKPQDLHCH